MLCPYCNSDINDNLSVCPFCNQNVAGIFIQSNIGNARSSNNTINKNYNNSAPQYTLHNTTVTPTTNYGGGQTQKNGSVVVPVVIVFIIVIFILLIIFALSGQGSGNIRGDERNNNSTYSSTTESYNDSVSSDVDITEGQTEENLYVEDNYENKEDEYEDDDVEEDSYINDGQVFPNSSSEYLSDSDVSVLNQDEIQEAINEIYARNGYEFRDEGLRDYFLRYDWYEPSVKADDFSEDYFSSVEKANIKLLTKYRD